MHVIFSGKNTTGTEKRASVSRGKGIFKVVISKKINMEVTITFQGHNLLCGHFLSSIELGAKMMWQECKYLHKKYSNFREFEFVHYCNIVGRLSQEDLDTINKCIEYQAEMEYWA